MRVLHVIQRYYPYVGGSERYYQQLGEQLVADGHEVTVLTTDAWDLEHFWAPGRRRIDVPQEIVQGVRVLRFPVRRAPGPPLSYAVLRRLMVELSRLPRTEALLGRMARLTPQVPGLERWLRTTREPFDLVGSANITLDFTILPALAFARRRNIPHVITPFVHLGEPNNPQIRRYYAMRHQVAVLKASRRVIVQTPIEREFLQAEGIPPERLSVVGAWVEPDRLLGGDGGRFRAVHGIGGPIVLTLGTAAYDKGSIHLLEAMQRLWAEGSDATLVHIGSSRMRHFDSFYASLPPEQQRRCKLLGFRSEAEKNDALAAAQVFALPSRTDTFGIVYLEAWCYELPVIGAYAGGVPDVIEDGETGFLVPFGDVYSLARRLGRLLHDRGLARRLGQQGRATVLREHTWANKYALIAEVYRQALALSLVAG
jgi:glycosyltransferase involved in cell wall biosynthesis